MAQMIECDEELCDKIAENEYTEISDLRSQNGLEYYDARVQNFGLKIDLTGINANNEGCVARLKERFCVVTRYRSMIEQDEIDFMKHFAIMNIRRVLSLGAVWRYGGFLANEFRMLRKKNSLVCVSVCAN
ncbi:27542_t:CDS:2 [Gigaspora margarita]|uniref:27542_t:CDS:1 n=1 Tax=Gigaspora margarita TaxID=4874 RepID=A0ABN7UB95_GIGMA|nr:27542_t:CDS:2 [Gigaspora margarita]